MYAGQVNNIPSSQTNLQREQCSALRPGIPVSSPLQEALNRLDTCISSLSASIDGLDAKTACVQAPTASDKPSDSPESSCSPLVGQINSLRDRIVRIDYQARMMLERIEL